MNIVCKVCGVGFSGWNGGRAEGCGRLALFIMTVCERETGVKFVGGSCAREAAEEEEETT